MSATGVDRLTVVTPNKEDAPDVARRQWAGFGFRMGRVIDVRPTASPIPGRWVVEAEIEVVRA